MNETLYICSLLAFMWGMSVIGNNCGGRFSLNGQFGIFLIIRSFIKFLSYSTDWIRALFVIRNGGYNVYHRFHQFSQVNGGGDAEKQVGKLLAQRYGKQVEFQDERSALGKRADLKFDGSLWDVKYITTDNERTIRQAMDDASVKADCVIFWWGEETDRLHPLISAYGRNAGYYRKKGKRMPRVFYFDSMLVLREIH